MTKNIDAEDVPDEVNHAIMMAKKFEDCQAMFMPHFLRIYREDMEFNLVTTKQVINLRSLMGDREKMIHLGHQIIILLVQGLQEMDDLEITMAGI